MKTKELITLLDNGVKPVIEFTNEINRIESADPKMRGRVIGYHSIDVWKRGTETIYFKIDMSEFHDYNKTYAIPSWSGNNGQNDLTWFESPYYPKNHITDICEMLIENFESSDLILFKIIQLSPYYEEFINQDEEKEYLTFLEKKLDNLLK